MPENGWKIDLESFFLQYFAEQQKKRILKGFLFSHKFYNLILRQFETVDFYSDEKKGDAKTRFAIFIKREFVASVS